MFFENIINIHLLYSQEGLKNQGWQIKNADSLVSDIIEDEVILRLINNVELEQGSVRVSCDNVLFYKNQNRMEFSGSVKVIDSLHTLKSDRIIYRGDKQEFYSPDSFVVKKDELMIAASEGIYFYKEGRIRGQNGVNIDAPDYIMTCNRMDYFEKTRSASAHGDVKFTHLVDEFTITGKDAFFEQTLDYGLITGSPCLSIENKNEKIKLTVTGDTLKLYNKPFKIVVNDNVRISRDSLNAAIISSSFLTTKLSGL